LPFGSTRERVTYGGSAEGEVVNLKVFDSRYVVVIALIFSYFSVPLIHQHRVLFWGVLGALVMRAIMIGAGAMLISRFTWMSYVLGAVLLRIGCSVSELTPFLSG